MKRKKAVASDRQPHKSVNNNIAQIPTNRPEKIDFMYPVDAIKRYFPDIELPRDYEFPSMFNFQLEHGQLQYFNINKGQLIHISAEPFFISGRYINITDGTEGLKVICFQDGRWKEYKYSRDKFLIQNKIVDLIGEGFPIDSTTARYAVKYLSYSEALNKHLLPLTKESSQMGWQKEGGFLVGKTYVNDSGEIETENPILFNGADAGERQFAAAFHSAGDRNASLDLINRTLDYPRVFAGVLASFGSPLLSLFQLQSGIVEWSMETSKGKSIAQSIAASIWGNPDDTEGIIRKWNATKVYLERTAAMANHLPIFFDDTKQAKRKDIDSFIYNHCGGQSRGRGSLNGSQNQKFWRTFLISTGESKITELTTSGGAAARALPINDLPFNKADFETSLIVDELDAMAKSHYGHLGIEFIQFVIKEVKPNLDIWHKHYEKAKRQYGSLAQGNTVAIRLSKYIAFLDTIAEMVKLCFGIPMDVEKILIQIWNEIIGDNKETDRPAEALKTVYSWACSNESMFYGRFEGSGKPKDCLGSWERKQFWEYISFYPHKLENFLKSEGYEPKAILKSWHDREWLVTAKKGRKFQKRMDGQLEWLYGIKRSAIESLEEG